MGWTVRGSNPGGGGEIFCTSPDRPWGPPSLLHNGYRVFFGGKERPGRDADPSPPSSAVGHERVELNLYSPYGPYSLYRASVPVQGWPLSLFFLPFKTNSWPSSETLGTTHRTTKCFTVTPNNWTIYLLCLEHYGTNTQTHCSIQPYCWEGGVHTASLKKLAEFEPMPLFYIYFHKQEMCWDWTCIENTKRVKLTTKKDLTRYLLESYNC